MAAQRILLVLAALAALALVFLLPHSFEENDEAAVPATSHLPLSRSTGTSSSPQAAGTRARRSTAILMDAVIDRERR